MAIQYQEKNKIFTLHTAHTTYQMKVDDYGFLLHLYYGGRVYGNMDYLLTCYDRGFSGNPSDVGNDRTYSMDVLPQEYPVMGIGDFRNSALIIRNSDGSDCCDLRYVGHETKKEKYRLPGLPAVYADSGEAETLEIYLEDKVNGVRVTLLYGVLAEADIITRSAVIENRGESGVTVLSNQYEILERGGSRLVLAGVDDPNGRADQTTPEELYAQIGEEAPGLFTLLLAHRNDHFGQHAAAGYDFVMSGHGHGGIVRLPFAGGLIGTNRRFFPPWTSGVYRLGDSALFVSRGLGNNTVPFQGFRLFNRPELAVVTLMRG